MRPLVAIVGPTATGKSQLAIHLALRFNGEIVSADSRQVYCYMDIGTAKPTREEQSLVRHHLVDIVNPDEDFSLARYQKLSYQAIADIQRRNKLALLVGGSGLYVWAALEGWEIPNVIPDLELRRSLEEKASTDGIDSLYQELLAVDPVAAQTIDRRNVRRLVRAIEVSRSAEAPFSKLQRKRPPPFETLIIGLTADRSELYRRIDLRVDRMLEQGLVEEVKRLLDMDYGLNLPAMSGIGYKQIGLFLNSELTLEEAIKQIKFETHRVARHQYAWFRLKDERIHWVDITDEQAESKIRELVAGFVAK